jgi:hypothetical protein
VRRVCVRRVYEYAREMKRRKEMKQIEMKRRKEMKQIEMKRRNSKSRKTTTYMRKIHTHATVARVCARGYARIDAASWSACFTCWLHTHPSVLYLLMGAHAYAGTHVTGACARIDACGYVRMRAEARRAATATCGGGLHRPRLAAAAAAYMRVRAACGGIYNKQIGRRRAATATATATATVTARTWQARVVAGSAGGAGGGRGEWGWLGYEAGDGW